MLVRFGLRRTLHRAGWALESVFKAWSFRRKLAITEHRLAVAEAERDELALLAPQRVSDESLRDLLAHLKARPGSTSAPRKRGYPNVFCLGFEKTATSYLYSVLRQHPSVSCYPKDQGTLQLLHLEGAFTADAVGPSSSVVALFEASFHEASAAGLETIKKHLCERPKIILCLREPVSRTLSEYRMRARQINYAGDGFFEQADFSADTPEQERRIARSCYADFLEACFAAVGRSNVHVVVMEEDLTHAGLAALFNFAGLLDADGLWIAMHLQALHRHTSRAPTRLDVTLHLEGGEKLCNPGSLADLKGGRVLRLEVRSDVPKQLDIDVSEPNPQLVAATLGLRSRLTYEPSLDDQRRLYEEHFSDDVARAERLLDRDLSAWYAHYGAASSALTGREGLSPNPSLRKGSEQG